ncbi:uncharacterized protein LOC113237714, partial [Hyposmocoma kahamanoa]|uniref:uncharacterized protein LOC113237714 n=1 Tax=Hyposmocoma kahamanoa TaxID=1477025 RepID=UPI000E6D7494
EKRPKLANAILFEIKTNDSGNVFDTSANITVNEGPLMVKISGDYDQVDHFWCQNVVDKEGEISKVFLTRDDFSEYENPKEAIAIIDTKNLNKNHTQWNCTLLTRKGTQIYQNNLYEYKNANYSKITWTGSVHIAREEAEENALLFKLNHDESVCESVDPIRNFTITEGSTLTVIIPNFSAYFYKFWCERVDTNLQSNSKVLETNLTRYAAPNSYYSRAVVDTSNAIQCRCAVLNFASLPLDGIGIENAITESRC